MEWVEPYLVDIWLFLIGFFLLYYAVTDGFDLGVGILSLFSNSEEETAIMMGSLKSIWHGNQTWLVLLGGMVFGAFPLFYSILLSSLYVPILIMLLGLIFRGVAFEFHNHAEHKSTWGLSFGIGSLVAAMAQGFALGGLLSGLEVEKGIFSGSAWSWVNPFSGLVTAGVLFGYAMLGANYLILKMEGELQSRSYRYAFRTSMVTLAISVAVHVWATLRYPGAAAKWTAFPDFYFVALFPALAMFAFIMFLRSLRKRRELAPILWNVAVIVFSFTGLSIGLYPNMIPNVVQPVTVEAAAASPNTLIFMLAVTAILLPVILTYSAYEYSVFRGKTHETYGE